MSNNGHHQEARETIQSFTSRFAPLYPNGDHVELIQLAAFPVAVTVHLLYQIWANFGTFIKNSVACKIDALAVNDCIQCNLFRQTGPDLFEMDAEVRQCLLEDLRANRGRQFVKEELAAFLYQYSRQNTQGSAWRNYYDAQQWTAIMEVDEKAAAEQILSSLAQELQKKNTSRGLGIVNLIAALEKDNKQFSSLLQNALNKPDTVEVEPGTVTSKRIVLTDEVIDGRTPVRINLPPSLSNRLKKIVKTDPSSADERSIDQEEKVYGFFVSLVQKQSMSLLYKISDVLVQKRYMRRENVKLLMNTGLAGFHYKIDTLLSTLKESDRIIIYINCGDNPLETLNAIITPHQIRELILKNFNSIPDVVVVLEADSITPDWYAPDYRVFTLIVTGRAVTEKKPESSFEKILVGSDRSVTYAEFYNSLLQQFVQSSANASIFTLPHLIPGILDLDQQLFSRSKAAPLDEVKKVLNEQGHDAEAENRLAELNEMLEGATLKVGRERVVPYLQVLIANMLPQKEVKSLWLLHRIYSFKIDAPKGTFSHASLWSEFFGREDSQEEPDVLRLVKELFETQILFIGLVPKLLSGINLFRFKTIMNICQARKILVYFVIEEECDWQQFNIHEIALLLNGATMLDYIEKEGVRSFLKAAYKDVENLINQEEQKKQDKQGKTYGIFVGINNYADKQFNLHESVNDARKMRVALENAQLLEAENARLIIDKEATRANVVNHLAERLSTAKGEDAILFYFSGHSSNQQNNSALFFHDLDQTSEYTSNEQNGILTDAEFNALIKTAPNNPTIILILDTHGGSRNWLDENNPKHRSIMATHLEEMCYELPGIGGMLTEAITQCLSKQRAINYIDLYQSVLNQFLAFAHDGNAWQTPLFIVHKDHWNDIFLSKTAEVPDTSPRAPKTYEYLQTRDIVQCLFYSKTEPGAFTFYNQVKFALHENRVDFEHLDTWAAIDKSFSVHNRFPDMIFIALKEAMYVQEAKYNIEKLLAIADAMQIPVYFILEDKREPDPSAYRFYPLLPADKRPVLSGIDIPKLIDEMKTITAPLVNQLKRIKEEYEVWGLSIGVGEYENLPGIPFAERNAREFGNWLSNALENKPKQDNISLFTPKAGMKLVNHGKDIRDLIRQIAQRNEHPDKKRVLYIYLCGYMLSHMGDIFLLLPSWSDKNAADLVNISKHIEVLINADFVKVIVLAEYPPLADIHIEKIESSGSLVPQILRATPAPYCFFKVPLMRHDNDSSERNSIVLDGLYGEAVVNNTHITMDSFRAYIYEKAKKEKEQYPLLSFRITEGEDFVIANLASSFQRPNTHNFKQKWVLVVGSSKSRLSQTEWMVTNAIAIELAKSGYGIITAGWRGVDAVVSDAYAAQLAKDEIIDEGYLIQVVVEKQKLEYQGGVIERVANEEQSYERIFARAYAVILIGGMRGTFESFRKAQEANVPVIPIAITGGDAAEAHAELKKRRLLPAYLLDELTKPVNNYEDAIRTADAVCNYLDEGFSAY